MQSNWYLSAAAMAAQLQALADAEGVPCLHNPALPLDLKALAGDRALFVMQRGDKVVDQPGQQREKRRMRLVVGAVALTATALADVDALHFGARKALRGDAVRAALRAVGDVASVREVEIEPELKDVATEGSALLSAFEIEYFQTYAA